MTWTCNYAALSHVGRLRDRNEDYWNAEVDLGLYVVADGMGGHLAGDLAARSVAEALPSLVEQRLQGTESLTNSSATALVTQCICELSNYMFERAHNEPGLDGIGATVVLALVREDGAILAHMGDSRAYLFRQGSLRRVTTDHSIVQLLIENGEISPEDAKQHPSRGQLTRFVGMESEPLPSAQFLELRDQDRLLLCTDGLTDLIQDERIEAYFREQDELESLCQCLIDAANVAGGRDNVTALVVAISDSESTA